MVFVSFLKKLALRYKILIPQRVPLVGGIAMGLSFIIACGAGFLSYGNMPQDIKGIIIASFIMLIFGVIDDLRELSIPAKFLVQMIAASLLVFFGVRTHIVYIGDTLNIIITFLWVLGISNAFNHLDVLDGLAGGAAAIVSAAFFIISFLHGDIKNAILALALAGSVLAFLAHNLPPARVYMGNSGSHFLGFLLAAIALLISYAPLERKIVLLSPILILGLPVFDTAFLILMRIKQGRSVFKKSNDHLALRLLEKGHSKNKALFSMLLLGLFFSLSGVILSQVSNLPGVVVIAFVILVGLIIIYRTGKVAADA